MLSAAEKFQTDDISTRKSVSPKLFLFQKEKTDRFFRPDALIIKFFS